MLCVLLNRCVNPSIELVTGQVMAHIANVVSWSTWTPAVWDHMTWAAILEVWEYPGRVLRAFSLGGYFEVGAPLGGSGAQLLPKTPGAF